MNVLSALHVRARGLLISEDDRAALERRVVFAIDRYASQLRRVDVAFEDVNGPKGGVDVRCRVHIALWDGVVVDVEARGQSPLSALAASLGRTRRALAKTRARGVAKERRSRPSIRVPSGDASTPELERLGATG